MSKKSGQQTESAVAREGKSYGYQQSQEAEGVGTPSISESKDKLLDAFDQLIDTMMVNYKPSTVDSGPGPCTSGGQGSVGRGQGVQGGQGSQGSENGSATASSGTGGQKDEAAIEVPISVLRESFREDQARQRALRRLESAVEAPTYVLSGMGESNKHQSDSNKAPLQTTQEFAPSFGNRGRSKTESMEVQVVPAGKGKRPETAPAPPQSNAVPLDAYWASFGTPIERAQERARIASARKSKSNESQQMQMMELIIGTDDRVLVTNNEAYPWRCICSLLITAQTGNLYLGTGWLVSPRLVLTAGHCVYMADEGGWASQIEVIPGRNGTSRPFGSVTSNNMRSVRGWTVDNNRDYDYGAILLPEGRRYGDELGWFGYSTRTNDYLRNITLNLSGYPGDGGKSGPQRQQGTQWFNSRPVRDVYEKQITYEIDTWGGQSGAPVWEMTSEGYRYGLAIHTWGTEVNNGATRITSEVFDNIVQWAGQVP